MTEIPTTPREAAIKFLKKELGGVFSLEQVCSDYRLVGGSSFGKYQCSLGNLSTTNEDNPAKNIKVEKWGDPKTYKFSVEEIYNEIKNENT